jgi:signal-transduction protein with cAMP-binding, CBS, and nucleotidyltransferase domain
VTGNGRTANVGARRLANWNLDFVANGRRKSLAAWTPSDRARAPTFIRVMDIDLLRKIHVFAPLSDEQLGRLATYATEFSVAAGEVLMNERDYAYDVLAIAAGTAEVRRGGHVIASVGPGELVGEAGALSAQRRSASVIATSPMRLIRLSHWDVRRLARIAPDALDRMHALAADRGIAVGR